MGITELEGTTAIVTGGASGIGLATSRLLAEQGCRVVVADVNDAAGMAAADEIGGEFQHLDVADPDAWTAVVDAIGGVDIAYLNAGVTTLPAGSGLSDAAANHFSLLEVEHYRRAMGINIDGVVFGARAVLPGMIERGGGVIVATSSLAGLIGFPPDPIYSVAKHAVIGLVRSLGPQLAPLGVSVHAVCPGITDTPIVAEVAKDHLRSAGFPIIPPEQIAAGVLTAIRSPETGAAWVCQAGREAIQFQFRQVPGPRTADGSAPVPPPDMAGNR